MSQRHKKINLSREIKPFFKKTPPTEKAYPEYEALARKALADCPAHGHNMTHAECAIAGIELMSAVQGTNNLAPFLFSTLITGDQKEYAIKSRFGRIHDLLAEIDSCGANGVIDELLDKTEKTTRTLLDALKAGDYPKLQDECANYSREVARTLDWSLKDKRYIS